MHYKENKQITTIVLQTTQYTQSTLTIWWDNLHVEGEFYYTNAF